MHYSYWKKVLCAASSVSKLNGREKERKTCSNISLVLDSNVGVAFLATQVKEKFLDSEWHSQSPLA